MIFAGKERGALELVDVSALVGEMLKLLKISVSKHAVLEASLGQGLALVRGNAAQIPQVVMSLITNASERSAIGMETSGYRRRGSAGRATLMDELVTLS